MVIKRQGMMFVLSSPSGVGKTTLTKKLAKNNTNFTISISHTTREPRPNEINGKDYYFINNEEFDSLIKGNNFFEYAKIFDNATSCSSENNLIILDEIYDDMLLALKSEGGLLFNDEQKNILEKSLWQNGQLNRKLLAKSVAFILNEISIDGLDSENSKFIMIEEKGIGKNSPFSGEKLSPILTIYKAKNFVEAKNIANEILNYQGKGHSIGIHSEDEKRILDLGLELPVCRVIVNQSHTFATGGSFTNGLPFSLSMGCGTWGGNSIDNNLNYKHFLNITKISKTIQGEEPSLRDYFDDYCETYSPDDSKLLQ